jgi:hypothetical protein
MKRMQRILWLAGLSLFVALLQISLCGYGAYVTTYFIRAVKPDGQDLERFRDARQRQLDLVENAAFIAILQIGILCACYKLVQEDKTGTKI